MKALQQQRKVKNPNAIQRFPEPVWELLSRASCRLLFAGAIAGMSIFALMYLAPSRVSAQALDSKAALRDQLAALTQEIDALRSSLRQLRGEEKSLAREIRLIEQEIKRTELAIARSEQGLADLVLDIRGIEDRIAVHEEGIARARKVLGELLQGIAEQDATHPAALLFSGKPLSEIADAFAQTNKLHEELLSRISALRQLEGELARDRDILEEKRASEEEAQRLLLVERDELRIKREFRERLFAGTKSRSQSFAQRLNTGEVSVVKIREQLYLLADLGRSLPFGEAYAIAKPLTEATGIRSAFLLAVLQKESHMGALVGSGSWRTDMHPRDWQSFLVITQELGLDPDRTPVSRKPSYGWGGAMGPAQFLPSTWLAYRERIAVLTGNDPPSPWTIQDAFAGAALKLAQGGAAAQTPEAEWKAAMLYFAGGNWQNPAYAFYGDLVEDLTAYFQEQIILLEHGFPSS